MFVPAFAFAWWLASLQPTRVGLPHAQSPSETSDDGETRGEGAPIAPNDGERTLNPSPAVAWDGERVKPKILTPAIVRAAQGFLDLPMGDERFMAVEGRRYVFVLQWHYHPPGFVGAPNGWHKGVTVFEIH